jgi:hypothetical protein
MFAKPISKTVIATLINYYENSYSLIENTDVTSNDINYETEYSNLFKTTVGHKQGGNASVYLFAIYVDNLINQLESKSK